MEILKKFNFMAWYEETFTQEEKNTIQAVYPFNEILDFNGGGALWLGMFSSYFNNKENAEICGKIIKKSIEENNETNPEYLIMIYEFYIKYFYKNREAGDNLQKAIEYALKQISLFPVPGSDGCGFETLAIIYKKNKEWQKVIEVCEMAIKNNSTYSDYEKRINEARAKLSK